MCWGSMQSWWGVFFFFFFDQDPDFYPRQSAQKRSGKEGGKERRRERRQLPLPLSAECQHLQLPPPPSHLTFLSVLQCKYITARRCLSHRKADCVCLKAVSHWQVRRFVAPHDFCRLFRQKARLGLKPGTPQFHHIQIGTA